MVIRIVELYSFNTLKFHYSKNHVFNHIYYIIKYRMSNKNESLAMIRELRIFGRLIPIFRSLMFWKAKMSAKKILNIYHSARFIIPYRFPVKKYAR